MAVKRKKKKFFLPKGSDNEVANENIDNYIDKYDKNVMEDNIIRYYKGDMGVIK